MKIILTGLVALLSSQAIAKSSLPASSATTDSSAKKQVHRLLSIGSDAYWQFRKPTQNEITELESVKPNTKAIIYPEDFYGISKKLTFKVPGKNTGDRARTLSIQALAYHAYDDGDLYQLVVSNEQGQVLRNDILVDDESFVVQQDAASKDVFVLSISKHLSPDFYTTGVQELILRKQSLLTNQVEVTNTGFDSRSGDIAFPAETTGQILLLSEAPNKQFGLFKLSSNGTQELIYAMEADIPGKPQDYEKSRSLFKPHAAALIGVFENMQGSFALILASREIVAVNTKTGDAKSIATLANEGQFVDLVEDQEDNEFDLCIDLHIAIYPNEMGSIFYSGIFHGSYHGRLDQSPANELFMSAQATENGFVLNQKKCNQ